MSKLKVIHNIINRSHVSWITLAKIHSFSDCLCGHFCGDFPSQAVDKGDNFKKTFILLTLFVDKSVDTVDKSFISRVC